MALKNINDNTLTENDIIRYYCKNCNKNVAMRITFNPKGIIGKCPSCKENIILKKNENYIPEEPQTQSTYNIPKCPICQSINIKKITFTSRAVKTVFFGAIGAIDDAGKTYRCENCGSKF